jgi:hypothetical protein
VRSGSRLPDISLVSIPIEQRGRELMYSPDRRTPLFRMLVDSLANSPTRQLPNSPSSQLASLSAAATDVMMQIGSRHDVIRWLFLAPQSFVRGLGMKGLKASCRREAGVFSAARRRWQPRSLQAIANSLAHLPVRVHLQPQPRRSPCCARPRFNIPTSTPQLPNSPTPQLLCSRLFHS